MIRIGDANWVNSCARDASALAPRALRERCAWMVPSERTFSCSPASLCRRNRRPTCITPVRGQRDEASGRKAHGQPYRYPHMLRGHVRLPLPPQNMPSPASPNLPRSTGGRSTSPADRSIVATRRPTSEAELPRLTAPRDRAVNGRSRSRQGGPLHGELAPRRERRNDDLDADEDAVHRPRLSI